MTFKQFYKNASDRSSAEWRELFVEGRDLTRRWIQAHGELAALLGFVCGILIVIFFRLFAWIVFLLFVFAAYLWLKTQEE